MKIDVTELAKKIVYNARTGNQNMKVIEATEKLDDYRKEFLAIKFVNQYGEYHYEKFYPDKHHEKLRELGLAIEGAEYKEGNKVIFDSDYLVGGFFNANLEHVPLKNGEVSRSVYIRDIRSFPRRKDTTGSMGFKRARKRK